MKSLPDVEETQTSRQEEPSLPEGWEERQVSDVQSSLLKKVIKQKEINETSKKIQFVIEFFLFCIFSRMLLVEHFT